jgi:hypothetical protein
MNTKMNGKKLKLNKETVKRLANTALAQVRGAISAFCTRDCTTTNGTINPGGSCWGDCTVICDTYPSDCATACYTCNSDQTC